MRSTNTPRTKSLPQHTPSSAIRHFGTVLSVNSPATPSSSVKKSKVRVVGSAQSSRRSALVSSSPEQFQEYTVHFEPGPIGLQIEPISDAVTSGNTARGVCRVQRFVDGGPSHPGAARKCGEIQLGDIVVAVNGKMVESYESAVRILKDTSVRRSITLRSVLKKRRVSPRLPGTAKKMSAGKTYDSPYIDAAIVVGAKNPSPFQMSRILPSMDEENTIGYMQAEPPSAVGSYRPSSDDCDEPTIEVDLSSVMTPSQVANLASDDASLLTDVPAEKKSELLGKVVRRFVAQEKLGGIQKNCSQLSSALGEALAGESSEILDKTITLKMQLLQELSQANAASELAQEKTEYESQQIELHGMLEDVTVERDEALVRIQELEAELAQVQSESSNNRSDASEEQLRIAELEGTLHQREKAYDDLEKQNLQLEREMSTVRLALEQRQELPYADAVTELQRREQGLALRQKEWYLQWQQKENELNQQVEDLQHAQRQLARNEEEFSIQRINLHRRECELGKRSPNLIDRNQSKAKVDGERGQPMSGNHNDVAQADCMPNQMKQDEVEAARKTQYLENHLNVSLIISEQKAQTMERIVTQLRKELSEKETLLKAAKEACDNVAAEKMNLSKEVSRLTAIVDETRSNKLFLQRQLHHNKQRLDAIKHAKDGQIELLQADSRAREAKLIEEITEKDGELAKALEMVRKVEHELSNKQKEISEIHDNSLQKSQEIARLQSELERTNLKLSGLQSKFEDSQKEQDKIHKRSQRLDEYSNQLSKKESECIELRMALEASEAKIARLSNDLMDSQANLQTASNLIASFEHQKKHWDNRLAALQAEAEEVVETRVKDAVTMSDTIVAEMRSENSRLVRDLESSSSTINLLRVELSSISRQKSDLLEKYETMSSEVSEKNKLLSQKDDELCPLQNTIEDMERENRILSDEIDSLKKGLDLSQQHFAELTKRLNHVAEDSTKEKNSLAGDIVELKEELAESKTRNLDLERVTRSLRRNLAESEGRLVSAREALDLERITHKDRTASIMRAKKELEDRVVQLTSDAERLRGIVQAYDERSQELTLKVDSLNAELKNVKHELQNEKDSSAHLATARLKEQDSLAKMLAAERKKNSELYESVRDLQSSKASLEREISSSRAQLEEEIRKAKVDAASKAEKISQLLESRETDRKRLISVEEDFKQACGDLARLEESLRRSNEELERRESLLEKLRVENSLELNRLSEKHSAAITQFLAERSELEAALRKAEERKEAAEDRALDLEEIVMKTQHTLEAVTVEKNKLMGNLINAEDEVAKLQNVICLRDTQMNTSLDSTESTEFIELTRHDLKTRCKELEQDLENAVAELSTAKNAANQKSKHLEHLSQDLKRMSDEIERLVVANEQMQERLSDLKGEKEMADSQKKSLESKTEKQEKALQKLKRELDNQLELNGIVNRELSCAKSELEALKKERDSLHEESVSGVRHLKENLALIERERDQMMDELNRKRRELFQVNLERDEALSKIVQVEADNDDLHRRLEQETRVRELDVTRREEELDVLQRHAKALEFDADALRAKLADTETLLEEAQMSISSKTSFVEELTARLEQRRKELEQSDKSREELVGKLSEASFVVSRQQEKISDLERKAVESEHTASMLRNKVKQMQTVIQKMETSNESSGTLRLRQMKDLEERITTLDDERVSLIQENLSLREELRLLKQETSENQSTIEALGSKLERLKSTVQQYSEQAKQLRAEKDEALSTVASLRNQLDSKQMEINHLNATNQVSSSTIARMKGDYQLLQTAALESEYQLATMNSKNEEIKSLKTELSVCKSKLEVYAGFKGSPSFGPTAGLDVRLLGIIERIIESIGSLFREVTAHSSVIPRESPTKSDQLGALDLATDASKWSFRDFMSSFGCLSDLLQGAIDELQYFRSEIEKMLDPQLLTMEGYTTPKAKHRTESSAVLNTLEKMKRMLNDEILSPGKLRNMEDNNFDADYIQGVVHSLESQIDSLLDDLKSANETLQAKEQVFADLEELLANSENQRDLLEKELEVLNAHVVDVETRLKKEQSWKDAAEKELKRLREGLDDKIGEKNSFAKVDIASAAARVLVKAVEQKSNAVLSVAFRRWVCDTSVGKAVANQGEAASALASQLETTREKLVILKRHLRKNRRMRESGLDSITEGYETS